MTEYCDILEDSAEAIDELVDVSIMAMAVSAALALSTAFVAISPPVLANTADALTIAFVDSYALLTSAGSTSSTVLTVSHGVEVLSDSAEAGNTAFVALSTPTLASSGDAFSVVADAYVDYLFTSEGLASSTALTSNTASVLTASYAFASDSYVLGQQAMILDTASAAATVVATRTLDALATASATAIATVFASGVPQGVFLSSGGFAVSSLALQSSHTASFVDTAAAESSAWARDPTRVAWVLNTETTAACWYNNYDYESIAQVAGATLAVGPDGLYELIGDTDDGALIEAQVRSGFTDFSLEQVKRVDMVYMGYTSAGTLQLTAETQDSGHAPITYRMEQRAAGAPRNSRITLDKGAWGRYWRFTYGNIAGADFEIHDASIDVAISTRRV